LIDLKNQADTLIYSSEKAIKDAGDKVKDDDKKSIEEKIKVLKEIKDKDSAEEIKKALEDLSSEIQKIGAALYNSQPNPESTNQNKEKEAQDSKNETTDSKDENKKDEPIEGEFEETAK